MIGVQSSGTASKPSRSKYMQVVFLSFVLEEVLYATESSETGGCLS